MKDEKTERSDQVRKKAPVSPPGDFVSESAVKYITRIYKKQGFFEGGDRVTR
jgi:hypothetical protein